MEKSVILLFDHLDLWSNHSSRLSIGPRFPHDWPVVARRVFLANGLSIDLMPLVLFRCYRGLGWYPHTRGTILTESDLDEVHNGQSLGRVDNRWCIWEQ